MTTESLAVQVQQGDKAHRAALWERVEGLVRWWAAHGHFGIEFDEFISIGYIAMCQAAETYQPERGSFAGWLLLYCKTELANCTQRRTERQKQDPIHRAASLDVPIDGSDDLTLCDIVMDPCDAYEDAEARIYNEQLHSALCDALARLPDAGKIIGLHYFDGLTLQEIGLQEGCSTSRAQQKEQAHLKELRRDKRLQRYIDERTDFFYHVGVPQYSRTGVSAVEAIVMKRDKRAQRHEESEIKDLIRKRLQLVDRYQEQELTPDAFIRALASSFH